MCASERADARARLCMIVCMWWLFTKCRNKDDDSGEEAKQICAVLSHLSGSKQSHYLGYPFRLL